MTKRQEDIKKIRDMIEGIDFAMLVTENEKGEFHSRPMSTQKAEFDGDLWFFAETNSDKMAHIRHNPAVNVAYAADGKYISVFGNASIVMDVAKKKEMWHKDLEFYFKDERGPESPNVALIHVDTQSAQYWDTPAGPIGQTISLIKIALTGDEDAGGESEKVTFK